MRNKVVLGGGYTCVLMHSGETVCDVVGISRSVLHGTVKGHEKVLPSPKLLAIRYSLHIGEQGFVICQDYKLVFSQLSNKNV